MTNEQAEALESGAPIWAWYQTGWHKASFVGPKRDSFPYYMEIDLVDI
jgi:hypothetical protein